MIHHVREPKSTNIAPSPLKVILNNLHYEQRSINYKQYLNKFDLQYETTLNMWNTILIVAQYHSR